MRDTAFFICFFAIALAARAQVRIQTPDEFFPHKIGEQFSEHSQLVAYYRHLAANSDRIKLLEFGRSNQQRPQLLAIVSAPENLNRLEDIRLNNLRNAGLAERQADNTAPLAIIWLGFSVHGNEAAGAEAAIPVLYELANPTNQETLKWLKKAVVLIEPCVNPDGYSRYTSWYRQVSPAIPDPYPDAREHAEPWPGGRSNHYLFDLNRDWAWACQIETQNRLKIYNDWLPHVVADLHEQYYDSPYFFPPAAPPYHTYFTEWQAEFQVEMGKNNAKHFDKNGWLYYTKEVFDLLYPSYGDTYPSFNGAIGMTYEQGGHSLAGRAISLPNHDTLTLADRITHHKTAALSTVEFSSENAARLVENFADFYKKSKENPPGPYKTYVIKASNPPQKIEAFTAVLSRHNIRFGLADKAETGLIGYDYAEGKDAIFDIGVGDLLISAYQPKGLFAQVLLNPETMLADSNTYDATAWSLIYAHGLEAFATKQRVEPVREFSAVSKAPPFALTETPYAYLCPWNSTQSVRFLAEILKSGIAVRYAEEAFSIGSNTWPAGTLVVTKADNRKLEGFDQKMQAASRKFDYPVTPVSTGFVDQGRDFGSGTMHLILRPRVLVLSGEKTYSNEFGEVWFYFDKEVNYPATIADAGRLPHLDLSHFNVIILPGGNYDYEEAVFQRLEEWIRKGGRLIALGSANNSLAGRQGFGLEKSSKSTDQEAAETRAGRTASELRTRLYKDRMAEAISNFNPGAIVRVKIDPSHPLAFGLKDYYFSMKTNSLCFDLSKDAWNVGYLEEDFLSLGFIGSNLRKNMKNTAVFVVQNKEQGKIIYLIDNPLFRSFWEQGKLVFGNVVFF